MTNATRETDGATEMVDGIEVTDETQEVTMTTSKKKATKAKTTARGAKQQTTTKAAPKKPTSKASTTKKGAAPTKAAESKTTTKKPAQPTKAEVATPMPAEPKELNRDGKTLTLGELVDLHAADLAERGKSEKTIASYRNDMRVAVRFFGEGTRVKTLTPTKVNEYFESDAVCKNRKGERRSEITIAKVRRTFRMALERLAEVGIIDKAPVPETAKKARGKKDDAATENGAPTNGDARQ